MKNRSQWIVRFLVLFFVSVLVSVTLPGTIYAAKEKTIVKVSSNDQSRPSGFVGKVVNREKNTVKNAKINYVLHFNDGTEDVSGSVVSNQNGSYRIDVMLPDTNGNFTMDFTVEAEGYLLYRHRGSEYLEVDEIRNLDFYIYEPSTIVGTVTDNEGKPVANAMVKVTGLFEKPVKTNQRGIYTVTGIDYDYNPNIAIWIDKEEYLPYVQDRLGISPGETRVMNVVLEKAANVRGKIIDDEGKPIEKAKVIVNGEAVTDKNGDYLIKRVKAGSATFQVTADGYARYSIGVNLLVGDRNTYNIVLKKNSAVKAPVTKYRLVPLTDTHDGKTYIKGFVLKLIVTDKVNGIEIQTTQYRFNGGNWITYKEPVKFISPDVKTIEYYTTDVAGNKEKINKMDFVQGKFEGAGEYVERIEF
jgi:hypothetical protein